MAKKKRSNGRRKITLAVPIVLPIAFVGYNIVSNFLKTKDYNRATEQVTGYNMANGSFTAGQLAKTYWPIAAGVGIHYAAKYMGVNRTLAQAKVPLIRM